jgi:hypothetical protein
MAEQEFVPEADRWRCRLCDKHYVVPILARDCEDRHMKEEETSG